MRVLFVTNNYLHIQGGGAYATKAIVNAFAEVADSVKLLYPAVRNSPLPKINPLVEAIPIYYECPMIIKAFNVYFGKIHRYYNVFNQYIDSGIDTVVFDTSIASHKLIDVAKTNKLRVITIHHNYQVEFAKDDTTISIKYPLVYWVRKAERTAVLKSDLNICLTNSDVKALKMHYSKDAKFRVLGIFEPENRPALDTTRHVLGHNYIITGNLSVKQTTDALYPWIREYYPILKKVDPKGTLRIAGFKPQRELFKLCAHSDIEIVDSPPDMDPYLLGADYYICPTNLGSGIKLRIMDGLRAGMPVITHTNSLRGYDSFLNTSVFIYDNKLSFENVIRKIQEREFCHKSIQEEYLREFSFDEGVKRLRNLLNS